MRPQRPLALMLLLLVACSKDPAEPKEGNTQQDSGSPDSGNADGSDGGEVPLPVGLELELSASSVLAGAEVPYVATLSWSDGVAESVEATLSDSAELGLSYDADTLTPTIAGGHVITASVELDGTVWSDDEALEVLAGAAASLDLELEAESIAAGESLGWTVTAADAWGNPLDASRATITDVTGEILLEDGRASATLVGTYTLEAALDELTDQDSFTVVAGAPATIELSLSDTELELGDSTRATVTMADAWGNPVEAEAGGWSLSTSPAGPEVDGDTITFTVEGVFDVTATLDEGGASDTEGPLTVDSHGPEILVSSPERGSTTTAGAGSISGLVTDAVTGVASLTVNGDAVVPSSGGDFFASTTWVTGVNQVEVTAVDGDGNTSTWSSAVLAGDFLPDGDPAENGMVVRLFEGPGGFDELEVLAQSLITADMLDDLIPSPAVNYFEEECVTLGGVRRCTTLYALELYLEDPAMGSTGVALTAIGSNKLRAQLLLNDISLDWRGDGTLLEVDSSGSGQITADRLSIVVIMSPSVVGDQIEVELQSVTVTTTNLDISSVDTWVIDLLDVVGIDLDGLVEGYLEDAVEEAIREQLPLVLEDTLQDLEVVQTIPAGGQDYTLRAVPSDISVDLTGLTLWLATTFEGESWLLPDPGPGSLYADYGAPTWTTGPGAVMGVSGDFVNQVLYAMWGGGLFHQELSAADLGLASGDIEGLPVDISTLVVTMEPLLPPVVVPGAGASAFDMQLGDMLVGFYFGDPDTTAPYLEVSVNVVSGLDLSTAGTTLEASLGATSITADVLYPDPTSPTSVDTEAVFEVLVPAMLPLYIDSLASIEIPAIEGYTLSGISSSTGGAEGGYLLLSGDLSAD